MIHYIVTSLIALTYIYSGRKTFKQLNTEQKQNILIALYSFLLFASGLMIGIILLT